MKKLVLKNLNDILYTNMLCYVMFFGIFNAFYMYIKYNFFFLDKLIYI